MCVRCLRFLIRLLNGWVLWWVNLVFSLRGRSEMRSFESYVTVVSYLHLVTKLIEVEGRVRFCSYSIKWEKSQARGSN